jgi:hypothetical protein
MPARLLALLLLCACAEEAKDTGPTFDTDTEDERPEEAEDPCGGESVELDVIGDDPPSVGDTWTVLMRCGDSVLTGTLVIRIEPPELGSFENNEITWNAAGAGLLTVQMGSYREEREIEVLP